MPLTPAEARAYYDAHAGEQDRQAWYEDPALAVLTEAGRFGEAEALAEAGCGTGRFAEALLAGPLPARAVYCGLDISPRMLALAGERLARFGPRVQLIRCDATRGLPLAAASCDRFIAAYLIDLLSRQDAAALIAEAHRVLKPGALICLASLTGNSRGPVSRAIAALWGAIAALAPRRVGGCRPVSLAPLLAAERWEIVARRTVAPRGVPSEAIVARKV